MYNICNFAAVLNLLNMKFKHLLTLSTAFLLFQKINAQRYLGLSTSNWSGTPALYLNPALIADSRVNWSIDLFSLNMGLDNNLATINTNDIYSKLTSSSNFKLNDFLKYNNGSKFDLTIPGGEVRGPGIYFNIKNKHSFALTTRARIQNQFRNFSSGLFRSIVDQNFQASNGNIDIEDKNFNWTANVWSEIGLSYATTLISNKEHALRGGATVRYLGGAGYIGMHSENLDAEYYASNDSMVVKNTDFHIASNLASNANGVSSLINGNGFLDGLFGKGSGMGIGLDLGLTYEYRPNNRKYTYEMDGDAYRSNPEQDGYLFRISAAVTDLGSMKYKTGNTTAHIIGNGYFKPSELDTLINDFDKTKAYFRNKGFNVDTNSNSATLYLPTALVLGIDFHIHKSFYVNATYFGGLNTSNNQYGNITYNQLSVTPRYDSRVISVGLPLTYNFTSQSFKAGLGLRVSGFFLGSDDVLGLVGSSSTKGVNFYLGASIPFNKRKLKDRDGDKVSNKKDLCPDVLGTWADLGCPPSDTDGDGIVDSLDLCVDVPGTFATQGCPDKDGDGIADGEDSCPDLAGPKATKGCPDRDGDLIPDADDLCPDVPGLAKYQGCADTDGDGIPDNKDACPEKAGPPALEGCPDTDGDGIADHLDRCPTVPGTMQNNGCPEIRSEVKKRLAFAATAIQFETGKAVIKATSHTLLDEIVAILVEYSDYNMTIDGHTDNVGKPDKNQLLSQERAEAVKNYFVSKGISTDRLTTNGYGDTQPKASNKTAKGRAENRRVEMDLKLK
jgi:outer membrane protein OmpA-like peptidoglycan-associated protein